MRAALRAVQFENVEAEAADEERGGGRRGGGRRGGSASFYVAQISVCVCVCVFVCVCVENSPTSRKTARVHARTSISV